MSKSQETATKLGISAAAMVTAAYVGSLIGDSGTLIGTGIGAVVGGGATELYQHVLNRGKHHFKSTTRRNKAIIAGGVAIAISAVVGYSGLTAIEAAANKPLHSITTGTPEQGTSLGGTQQAPVSHRKRKHKRHPTPSPSISPTPSITPSSSPSPTFSSSPTLSPSPTISSILPTSSSPSPTESQQSPVEPTP